MKNDQQFEVVFGSPAHVSGHGFFDATDEQDAIAKARERWGITQEIEDTRFDDDYSWHVELAGTPEAGVAFGHLD